MPESDDHKSDCYAAGERQWMEYGQNLRAYWLQSMLVVLTKCHISPDLITYLAGALGLSFVPLWLLGYKLLAIAMVTIHVLLDGLDGPLARFQGIASPRGSFVDTFTDQLVVTGVTIAWMLGAPSALHVAAGSLYLFLYVLVVAMAMVRNAMAIPYSWLVRPRFFVYFAIVLDWWLQWELTVVVLVICNTLLAIKCISGFMALRRDLPGPENELNSSYSDG